MPRKSYWTKKQRMAKSASAVYISPEMAKSAECRRKLRELHTALFARYMQGR